jgi:DNA-binding response OmpR family regulator
MRSLRQKLEGAGSPPAILINEPGIGYRFRIVDPDAAKPA